MKKVLIAGGAGFIGSTLASRFKDAKIEPVILDNLSTGRIEFTENRIFYQGDIADSRVVNQIFTDHPEIELTILCAASILVPESMVKPLLYYQNNVANAIQFLVNLANNHRDKLIFSSSASIYRSPADFVVTETSEIAPASPYANTKAVLENIFFNLGAVNKLKVISLRYFNPIGADPKMRTGLQIKYPTHALGKLILADETQTPFNITGTNWPTRDGSGIRDYIHVWDLAEAHLLAALKFNEMTTDSNAQAINLGTGTGNTVFELVNAYEKVVKHKVRIDKVAARPGDVAGAYADNSKAKKLLNWQPGYSLEEGINDSLQWFKVRKQMLTLED